MFTFLRPFLHFQVQLFSQFLPFLNNVLLDALARKHSLTELFAVVLEYVG